MPPRGPRRITQLRTKLNNGEITDEEALEYFNLVMRQAENNLRRHLPPAVPMPQI